MDSDYAGIRTQCPSNPTYFFLATDCTMRWNSRNLRLLPQKAMAKTVNLFHRRVRPSVDRRLGKRRRNSIGVFYWTGCRNFGDLITPALLQYYGATPILEPADKAELAATGSILGMLPENFCGTVLGSGLLSENTTLQFPQARILALRGEETKRCLGFSESIPLGDPGLLASRLVTRQKRIFRLGIVPHYEDLDHPLVWQLARRLKPGVQLINVQQSPQAVIQAIDRCENILSSSLHGVITADSLGIPNAWTTFSDRLYGGGFKFRDYYSAFGEDRPAVSVEATMSLDEIVDLTQSPPERVGERAEGLARLFQQIVAEIKKQG